MILDADDHYDYLFKIVLIGDAGVGKSCIVQQFKCGTFIEKYGSTIGVDFTMKTIDVDGKRVKLQIWDTAGQERFRTITQSYYRCANGVVLVYDITKRDTFISLPRWLDDIKRHASDRALQVLIGNKCDLDCQREVQCSEGDQFARQLAFNHFLETSAKDGTNIDFVFRSLAESMKRAYDVLPTSTGSSIKLNSSVSAENGICNC